MIDAVGFAAKNLDSSLERHEFQRDEPGEHDVVIDVMFCGVCHSDVHQVRNEWANTVYPCMPGHEAVGRVSRIGAAVTAFTVGDIVGVGCMVDSCRSCDPCQNGEENYCEGPNSWLATYNGPMIPKAKAPTGENMYGRDNTFGGYSNIVVVAEDYVLSIPDGLAPEAAAPILCAGVTTWSPLNHWGIGKGDKDKMHAQHQRNYRFFDAPVGLMFTLDRVMGRGSLVDYGMFMQNLMVAARGHGLHTCPQAAWNGFAKIILPHIGASDNEMLVCGMALGYADETALVNTFRTPRVAVSDFTTWLE